MGVSVGVGVGEVGGGVNMVVNVIPTHLPNHNGDHTHIFKGSSSFLLVINTFAKKALVGKNQLMKKKRKE